MSGDITASINLFSSIGNDQEYLVGLYIRKMNLFEEDIRVTLVILEVKNLL